MDTTYDLHIGLETILKTYGFKITTFKRVENNFHARIKGDNLNIKGWVELTNKIMNALDTLFVAIKRISGFGEEFIVVYGL